MVFGVDGLSLKRKIFSSLVNSAALEAAPPDGHMQSGSYRALRSSSICRPPPPSSFPPIGISFFPRLNRLIGRMHPHPVKYDGHLCALFVYFCCLPEVVQSLGRASGSSFVTFRTKRAHCDLNTLHL